MKNMILKIRRNLKNVNFQEKVRKLKAMIFFHFMTNFYNFAVKVKTSCSKWFVKPVSETTNPNVIVYNQLIYSSINNSSKYAMQHRIIPNRHINKMDPEPLQHYIFGNHFYSKNARKLRFHVFLHFNARKHMTLLFYLKWTKLTRNVNLFQYNSGPWGPAIETKFTISCEFCQFQVK